MDVTWRSLPEFPTFRDLAIEDKPLFDSLLKTFPPSTSDLTFTNLYIWRNTYRLKISRFESFLCLLADLGERSFFFPALGDGDRVTCFKTLLEHLSRNGSNPKIARVPENVAISFDWPSAGMMAHLDRDQSDYVYLVKDLAELSGRKYHRKRNHIKQFKDKYSFEYVALTLEWIPNCLQLQTEWCDFRRCDEIPGLAQESVAIKGALSQYENLRFTGGMILIDGKVEAFTLGEPLNHDTVVIHIEKANPKIEGLYTFINQAFLEKEWTDFTYVNREQDLGEEGLRKAKKSYFPHHMANKYTLTLA